jgi:tetratricopeptide (TPR) repeat protein
MRVDRRPWSMLLLHPLAGLTLVSVSALACYGQAAPADPAVPLSMLTNDNSAQRLELTKEGSPDLKSLSTAYDNAAQRYLARHLYPDALKYFLLHYDACKRAFGESHPTSARALNHVGQVYFLQGQYLQAQSFFQRALKISELNGDPNVTSILLNNVGVVGVQLGDFSAAQRAFEKAAAFYETQRPADPGLGLLLNNFAQLEEGVGNLDAAMAIAGRAASILEKRPPSQDLALSLTLIGKFRMRQGDFAGAEKALERSRRCLQQTGDEETVVGAAALRQLAKLYAATRRQREAEPLFKHAIQIDERFTSPDLIQALKDYAAFLRATKRKHEAKELEAELHARSEKFLQDNPSGHVVDVRTLLREQRH